MEYTVTSKTVEAITIMVKDGEAIKVTIDPDGPKAGRATVVLFGGRTGSYYWNAPGKSLKEFLATAPSDYLVDKLFNTYHLIGDESVEGFLGYYLKHYKDRLREAYFIDDKDKRKENRQIIREAFDDIKHWDEVTHSQLYYNQKMFAAMTLILGFDWYTSEVLPQIDNPIYYYQKKAIEVVQAALKEQLANA